MVSFPAASSFRKMSNKYMTQSARTGISPRRRGKAMRPESSLCVYADFSPLLPTPIPRRQILRLADSGGFPKYRRPAGLRSEPVFNEREVIDWYRQTFGDLAPDLVDDVERNGFVRAKPSPRERGV